MVPCCSQESKRDHHLPPIDVEVANEEANIHMKEKEQRESQKKKKRKKKYQMERAYMATWAFFMFPIRKTNIVLYQSSRLSMAPNGSKNQFWIT